MRRLLEAIGLIMFITSARGKFGVDPKCVSAKIENITRSEILANQIVRISWEYDADCQARAVFRVTAYVEDEERATFRTVFNHINMKVTNICAPLKIVVSGYNGYTGIHAHKTFEFDSVPREPTNFIFQGNSGKWLVTWEDLSHCANSRYTVSVNNSRNEVFYTQIVNEKRIQLLGLDFCAEWMVSVTAFNQAGKGPTATIRLSAVHSAPVAPDEIEVTKAANSSALIVSWSYESLCHVNTFNVTVYTHTGTQVLSMYSSSLSLELNNLPVCLPLSVRVFGINEFGAGYRGNSEPFIIPSVPDVPQNLVVLKEHLVPYTIILWNNVSPCKTERFTVTVYDSQNNFFVTVETVENWVKFTELPTCVNLTASVFGRNVMGNGSQALSDQFFIPSAPEEPKNIKVRFSLNWTEVDVSWLNTNLCHVRQFVVTLYSQGKKIQQTTASYQGATLKLDNVARVYRIGVLATNEFGESSEVFSDQFHKLAGTDLSGPRNLSVKVVPDKPIAAVSWTHKNSTNFTVSVYKGNNTVTIQQTSTTHAVLDNLPKDVPLRLGVMAHTPSGNSLEIMSGEFSVPTDKPRQIKTSGVNKRIGSSLPIFQSFRGLMKASVNRLLVR